MTPAPGRIHESFVDTVKVKGSSDRSFGFVFTVVFLVIGLLPLIGGGEVRPWALVFGGVFLVTALIRPVLLQPLNRLWAKFGLLLHRVTNPIIMGLIFFLAVTPTAWIMRAAGKDPLRRRFDPVAKSYWIKREPPGPAPDSIAQQF